MARGGAAPEESQVQDLDLNYRDSIEIQYFHNICRIGVTVEYGDLERFI